MAALPSWCDPAVTALAVVLMGVAVALSFLLTRKLVAAHLPDANWRSVPLYLIPGLYGGGFSVMLIAWRLF